MNRRAGDAGARTSTIITKSCPCPPRLRTRPSTAASSRWSPRCRDSLCCGTSLPNRASARAGDGTNEHAIAFARSCRAALAWRCRSRGAGLRSPDWVAHSALPMCCRRCASTFPPCPGGHAAADAIVAINVLHYTRPGKRRRCLRAPAAVVPEGGIGDLPARIARWAHRAEQRRLRRWLHWRSCGRWCATWKAVGPRRSVMASGWRRWSFMPANNFSLVFRLVGGARRARMMCAAGISNRRVSTP